MCTSVTRFWKREVYSKLAKKSKGILRKLTKKFRLRTYLKNVQKKMVAYQKTHKTCIPNKDEKSRGFWIEEAILFFFLYSYVALVSPKKARFILGSFASETDKSHLLGGGGCFFFSSHPWDLFVFFLVM